MRYVPRMWKNLDAGLTFDVTLVVAANRHHRERLRRLFDRKDGWNKNFGADKVSFASLDELGRPWKGGNFDASLFAAQRIRRLLRKRGIPDGQGRSLAVVVAGQGTRAYPLTAAEGGNKSMIQTPACLGGRPLRLVELVIAQYHQILDDVEPGRIHIAAGDHLLAWARPPHSAGGQPVQIFAHKVSFAEEAREAGLLDSSLRPRWADDHELLGMLDAIDIPARLPVLHSLTQMGLLKASAGEEDLLQLAEKDGVPSILKEFADPGGEARVNWWDWSLSPEAARLLVAQYADLLGSGIDLSIDLLEPVTMEKEEWLRRRPGRNPDLWDRANTLFGNSATPRTRPLGHIGVADPGEGSVFADLGTLKGMHDAYASVLDRSPKGDPYRSLLCARLEDGVLFVGERPGPEVEVEPGSIVMGGGGIRAGRIGAGSFVVDAKVREIRTAGPCIVYGVQAPERSLRVANGGVAADVFHNRMRHTVRASLFNPPKAESDPAAWSCPQFGNPMSFSDLQDALTKKESPPTSGIPGRIRPARRQPRAGPSWKRRPPNRKVPS